MFLLGLALVVVPRLSGSLAEASLDVESCTECHGDPDAMGSEGFVNGDAFLASVHGFLDDCTSCHKDVTEVPHEEHLRAVGLAACAECHAEVVDEYRQGAHGAITSAGVADGASCSDCHGDPHRMTASSESGSPANWSRLADTCARCHANRELATKFQIPIVQPVEAYSRSVHAAAVKAGRRGAVCSDCHGAHRILPATHPDSRIAPANVPRTCGSCHQEVLAQFERSVHGEAMLRGERGAPVCTDCHGEHRILGPADVESSVFSQRIGRETCGQCHANARLAERYGLSPDKVPAFEDSFHGLALRAGQLSVANCASCHGVHDILPSSNPRSHTHPDNLPDTCGKCHPGAGKRFAIGPVHVVAAASPLRAEYWIRLVYFWLIAVVIGLMALHNGADLARKGRRGERQSFPPLEVPERMPRVLRWQHWLVMLSFPVLVYTGFALTYPESWWARPLLAWETRFGLRGLLHRAAALVLLSGLVWHFAHLLTSPVMRGRLSGLRWSRNDWRHLKSMAAYYVGWRSQPPPGAPFTYVEKAEYWAFLWGTVVMTVTGFVLWFSDAVLRYLPKWLTDIATAIHFYEAVLATLAIVVWHFYWVIFDPDVYPMDWSWWDGKPPTSRAVERGAAGLPEQQERRQGVGSSDPSSSGA
jgi:cytochrome b subunit of formate dehydrogenase